METSSPTLFIEINDTDFIFIAGDENEQGNFEIIYKHYAKIQGIENQRIVDLDLTYNTIKKNIYLIEQKLNFTFKDTVLILNNFNLSFLNLTGFKKLNGSQILKENITYILNSMKTNVSEIENKKNILHIFNSNYFLDKKKINNLPIGLFGDFYSHELAFCLINKNDYKNLKSIFNKCNLKIKKIILKSFTESSFLSDQNPELDTFFIIKINKKNSQISYFENDALKFDKNFKYGSDIIAKDICKTLSLSRESVNAILQNFKIDSETSDKELVEKELFQNENFRKIKKKLILKIGEARVQELSEIFFVNNIDLKSFFKKDVTIFLMINDEIIYNSFKKSFNSCFSKKNYLKIKNLNSIELSDLICSANKLAHFGWKKEAIPVIHENKSKIAKFFDAIFGN